MSADKQVPIEKLSDEAWEVVTQAARRTALLEAQKHITDQDRLRIDIATEPLGKAVTSSTYDQIREFIATKIGDEIRVAEAMIRSRMNCEHPSLLPPEPEPTPDPEDYLASRLKGLLPMDRVTITHCDGSNSYCECVAVVISDGRLCARLAHNGGASFRVDLRRVDSVTIHAPDEGREAFWERIFDEIPVGDKYAATTEDGTEATHYRGTFPRDTWEGSALDSITLTRPEAKGGEA